MGSNHVADLTGIAFIAAFAVIMGFAFVRMRQPPIVGYILAGIVLGPTGLGLVANTSSIVLLAELGVIMLLFLIGMELSLIAFKTVLAKATLIVLAQVGVSLAITFSFAVLLDWPPEQAVLLGFIVAVSSTAVAIRILDEVGELRTQIGRITVGVLIAQDIAIVPMLVLVESMPITEDSLISLFVKLALTAVILFSAIYLLSRRGKIILPFTDAVRGNVDLLALGALAFCFAAAAITGVLGLSAAFGAFLAGLVVSSSTIRAQAIEVTLPIQSILMVVFFLSIGLLIDLVYVRDNLATVFFFVVGVLVAKSVVNVLLIRIAGEPWDVAFQGGLALGQIGEFSFVLATVGIGSGAIDPSGYRLAIAVIAISLLVSPLWMISVRRFHSVAQAGITDFRVALSEAYAEELGEIGKGAAALRRRRRALKAAYLIARRRRRETGHFTRRGAQAARQEASSAPATPDAYPVVDEDAQHKD
jgi:CPA2 family monovalent cation:H+ antiporter-2